MENHYPQSRLFIQDEPVIRLNSGQRDAIELFKRKVENTKYAFENVSCLCGEKEGVLIGTRDRYGLSVHTHLCNHCGMMWTSPRMTEDSLKEFYEKDYRPIYVGNSQAPDAFFRNQVEHGRKVYDYIISDIETESKKPLKVFDVGCGAGGNLLHFKENG